MAEEIIVGLFPCTFGDGGERKVPAGSRVVLVLGWAAKNRGPVQNFLQAQTTTISIDGGARVDLSDSYSAIEPLPDGGFATRIRYDIGVTRSGVTLSAGESLQVDGRLAVSHVVPTVSWTRPHIGRFSCAVAAHAGKAADFAFEGDQQGA